MSTSTKVMPAVRAACAQLIDYAGLFPPARLAMPAAVSEYYAARNGAYAWMLGRFIVPASRLRELLAEAQPGVPLPLSVIIDADADPKKWLNSAQSLFSAAAALRKTSDVTVEALEVPLPRLGTQRDSYDAYAGQCAMLAEKNGLRELPVYAEFPRDERWPGVVSDAFAALKRYRLRAKVRCGGLSASAFPSSEELAQFIGASAEADVPFKATAGLHHPLRHVDEGIGTKMHGFLNILAAVAIAQDAPVETLAQILEEEDAAAFRFTPDGFAVRGRGLSLVDIRRAREAFVAYGSCSFSEPVDDLTALSMLPK